MYIARKISLLIAGLMVTSVISSCSTPVTYNSVTASAGADKYVDFLKERLSEMPDSLVIASGDDTKAYGVDTSEFIDDEGYTIRASDGDVVILSKTNKGIDRAVRQFANYGNSENYSFTYGESYRVKKLTIEGYDIGKYAIICPDDADECMLYAADELIKYVNLATGVTLPEYSESEYAATANKPLKTISLKIDYPTLGNEAFTIDIKAEGNVDIIGGRYRGCMYGVYDLLRDIGWRFLGDATMEYVEYLYESDHVALTASLNRTEHPSIAQRSFWDGSGGAIQRNKGGLNVKLFGNHGGGIEGSAKYGGYGLVSPATHGLQIFDYKGLYNPSSSTQPCLTDEDILQVIEDNVVDTIQSRIDNGQEIGRDLCYIDVSQYDCKSFCMCDSCTDEYRQDGISGVVLQMTNRMADVVAEKFSPEISVTMLAYIETMTAPKVTIPKENVKIAYCFYTYDGTARCSKHSITGEGCSNGKISNRIFAKSFNDWSEICSSANMQVWYYPLNAPSAGFMSPFFNVIYDDMKYLTDNNIDCLMVCAHESTGIINHLLPNYLCSVMAWDPDITRDEFNELIREWCDIIFGDAGICIYEYIMMCETAGQGTANCWCSEASASAEKVSNTYMAENFDNMWRLYELAVKTANTERQEDLVKMYMAGMMYLCIGITHTDRYLNNNDPVDKAEFKSRYHEAYSIFTDYELPLFDNFSVREYVNVPFNSEENPFDSWNTSVKN